MDTIQDTVGRLAIAKENVTMGQKKVSEVMHFFFERSREADETLMARELPSPHVGIKDAIERLELAIHDLKIVQERMEDG